MKESRRRWPPRNIRIAGSNCNCGRHKLIDLTWYAWGPNGKIPLKTVPSCMRLRGKKKWGSDYQKRTGKAPGHPHEVDDVDDR